MTIRITKTAAAALLGIFLTLPVANIAFAQNTGEPVQKVTGSNSDKVGDRNVQSPREQRINDRRERKDLRVQNRREQQDLRIQNREERRNLRQEQKAERKDNREDNRQARQNNRDVRKDARLQKRIDRLSNRQNRS